MEYSNISLKKAITKLLKEEFPHCTILKDKSGSNQKAPTFFVRYLSVGQKSAGMDLCSQSFIVEVRYRPDNKLPENELSTHLDLIGGQLQDLLDFVRDEDFSARAESADYETSDGSLIMLLRYTIRKRIVTEQDPYMEDIEEKQEVKGNG